MSPQRYIVAPDLPGVGSSDGVEALGAAQALETRRKLQRPRNDEERALRPPSWRRRRATWRIWALSERGSWTAVDDRALEALAAKEAPPCS